MGRLYITEYSRLGYDFANLPLAAPEVPGLREQRVEFSYRQGQAEPTGGGTRFVDVIASEDCCLAFNQAASPRQHWLPSGQLRRYATPPGTVISVIRAENGE